LEQARATFRISGATAIRDGFVSGVWSKPLESLEEAISAAARSLESDVLGNMSPYVLAVSDILQDPNEVAAAHEECVLAARHRSEGDRMAGEHLSPTVLRVASLGAFRLVLRGAASRRIVDDCCAMLRKVAEYDKRHGSELIATFSAFLKSDFSPQRTATMMAVHPHTVQYRLKRFQQIFGISLRDAEGRLSAELAMRILDNAGVLDNWLTDQD